VGESKDIVERAQKEHEVCLKIWESRRQRGLDITEHSLETHFPISRDRIHDWRRNAKPGR